MTQLYRHFDGANQLLYVGIAEAASARQMAHSRHSSWMAAVRTITVSAPFRTRAEALAAEAAAIKTERPLYNRQHNPNPHEPPATSANLLRRLTKKGRRAVGVDSFGKRVAQNLAALSSTRAS